MLQENEMLALFLYIGDNYSGTGNYLALHIDSPEYMRSFLLNDCLEEVYRYGKMLGIKKDEKEINKIEAFMEKEEISSEDIENLQIFLPGACIFLSAAKSDEEIPAFIKDIKYYLDNDDADVHMVRSEESFDELIGWLEAALEGDAEAENYFRVSIGLNKFI